MNERTKIMETISIKQPWASLIVEGIKPIENRTWPCPQKHIGKRVLVHASAKPWTWESIVFYLTKSMAEALKKLGFNAEWVLTQPTGAIIGSVDIVDCVVNHPSIWAQKSLDCNDCPDVGACCDGKCPHIIHNWVLANPIKFPEPIPAKGKLSFWDYPNILAEPEEKGGMLYCHCQLSVDEKVQVANYGRGDFRCCYCGARWYK